MEKHNYSEEEKKWILRNYIGISTHELVQNFNKRFNADVTYDSMRYFKKNRQLRSGYDARFVKGQPSHNKGKHFKTPGSEKGWFKKGHIPHNHVPVGTLSWTTGDRYLVRKIAEPNVWEFEHKLIWTKANGYIPEGMMIIFLDGNRANCELNNLALISKAENQALNKKHLRSTEPELTRTGIALVRLEKAVSKAKHDRREE